MISNLGCVISSDNSIDLEITCRRIQSAASAFGALDARVWSQRGIKLATKCKLYRVFVLPCLLYSTETYTLYRRHLKKLTSIQLRHLRSIMGLTWRDRVCNGEVLQKASMESVEAMLVKSQLRWAGHVVRMPDDRLPKAVFYSELTSGKRKRGGQKLRYKDVLKRHLKTADMDVDTWESDAKNRPFWRKKILDAGNTIERKRKEKYLEGWRKRQPQWSNLKQPSSKSMGTLGSRWWWWWSPTSLTYQGYHVSWNDVTALPKFDFDWTSNFSNYINLAFLDISN